MNYTTATPSPRYRAVLTGVPFLERPIQLFGNDIALLRKWGTDAVRISFSKHPDAKVHIFERTEVEVESITAPQETSKGNE